MIIIPNSNMHSKSISSLSPLNSPQKSKPIKTIPNHTFSCKPTDPFSSPSKNSNVEIRVCTNRTCRRQGSLQILENLLGISPAHVSVTSCGCLGRCGSGPNLVVLPPAAMISHCGTAARTAELMVEVCGAGVDDFDLAKRSLDALAFRKRAEVEFEKQNYSEAENLYSQAIEAKPIGGVHITYKGRSAVRLASGNFSGALEDVREALVYAPLYAEAYICQGDIFLAMDQLEDAEGSYAIALNSDPSLRRSKAFKARFQMLLEKMTSVAMS
ncbi:uncharacterized protein LOC110692132 [Chenopodium quinoa]|uniref:uncharacterized protein LOC110692132 n=1 Tax=Chenopodium quinoa TaxID=63459 RepID=UPI000B792EA0|nr:uncharacterized protein LOC110692132 [Chenopodium quinoa]